MILTFDELKELVSVKSFSTLYTYLARADFAHVKKIKDKKNTVLAGITERDIDKLRMLAHRRNFTNEEKIEFGEKLKKLR